MNCSCGRAMYVAGTAGKGLGNIVQCSRCGSRTLDRWDLNNSFQATLMRERADHAQKTDPDLAKRLREAADQVEALPVPRSDR